MKFYVAVRFFLLIIYHDGREDYVPCERGIERECVDECLKYNKPEVNFCVVEKKDAMRRT